MNNEIPYDLIAKYLSEECNASEKEELEIWRNSDKRNNEIFEQMKCTWQDATPESFEPDLEQALGKVSSRIGKQLPAQTNLTRFWIRLAAALIIGLGIFTVVKITGLKTTEQTIETYAGTKPHQVVLPDGSKVILNANSVLKYPSKFKGNERDIEFNGEGYFIIHHDKTKPFIVKSGSIQTKVLGTEFNLNAPANDSIVRLTVTKGLVSFNIVENKEADEVLVKAGEAGEANIKDKKIKKYVNTDPNFMAWKTGILKFEGQELSTAIKTISSFYRQEILLSPGLDTVKFYSTFDSLTFKQVLENLQLMLNVDITYKDGIYILRQKS